MTESQALVGYITLESAVTKTAKTLLGKVCADPLTAEEIRELVDYAFTHKRAHPDDSAPKHNQKVPLGAWENPPDGGLHFHLLIHVPTDLFKRLRAFGRRWCEQAGASNWDEKIFRVEPLYYSEIFPIVDFERYLRGGLLEMLQYISKGADERGVEFFKLEGVAEYQGRICGKRIMLSQVRPKRLADLIANNPRRGEIAETLRAVAPELLARAPNT